MGVLTLILILILILTSVSDSDPEGGSDSKLEPEATCGADRSLTLTQPHPPRSSVFTCEAQIIFISIGNIGDLIN